MPRPPRPCLGYWDRDTGQHEPCGVLTDTGRCERHAAMEDAKRRPSPSRRGYDREYQRERRNILDPDGSGRPVPCEIGLPGCTVFATTANHLVPVRGGMDVAAAREGGLVPACAHCNSALGDRPMPRDQTTPAVAEEDDGWFPPP